MFKTIESATEVLMSRKNQTYGVDGLVEALRIYGNPHFDLKVIHIAGTNGKGSTTNYVRSILQTAGYKVGSFTSPHLHRHNDRIRINDCEINDETLLNYINDTHDVWERFNLSMFEIDMLISALYFKKENVDFIVYEVGLGGRLDATNVVNPLATAITNIGFDHQAILGDTLAKIAYEKAGIIKANIPLITTVQDQEALDVILDMCITKQSPYRHLCIPKYSIDGNRIEFELDFQKYHLINQPTYQVANASLAISLVKEIAPEISKEVIQEGLVSTHWAGRFEEVIKGVIIDGAHNEMGIQKLTESLSLLPKPWIIVFTALKDKDFHNMVSRLESVAEKLIVTEFDFYRAASAISLAEGHNALIIPSYKEAIEYGLKIRGEGTLIITGSLYFISDVRDYLLKKK